MKAHQLEGITAVAEAGTVSGANGAGDRCGRVVVHLRRQDARHRHAVAENWAPRNADIEIRTGKCSPKAGRPARATNALTRSPTTRSTLIAPGAGQTQSARHSHRRGQVDQPHPGRQSAWAGRDQGLLPNDALAVITRHNNRAHKVGQVTSRPVTSPTPSAGAVVLASTVSTLRAAREPPAAVVTLWAAILSTCRVRDISSATQLTALD